MSQHVFICHATEDKAVATVICEALEAGGVPCWIAPRDIKPGADYGSSIVKAIGEARALVLVLSTHSNLSEHVKREVERAVSRDVRVIPFRTEEILPSEALEYFISTTQWIDAITPPLEKHVGYLVENLKVLVPPEAKKLEVTESKPPPPPPAKSGFLRVPRLVTIAVAVVLVVAGLFAILTPGPEKKPGIEKTPNGTPQKSIETPKEETASKIDNQQKQIIQEPDRIFTKRAIIDDPDGFTYVRSMRSTSGEIVATVYNNEIFFTYIQDGNWWQVKTKSGKIGYMHVSRMRLKE